VARAERLLDEFHRRYLGASHPWLREHRGHGLPDLAATEAALSAALGTAESPAPVVRRPNADLERWFLIQLGMLLSQVIPVARGAWAGLQDPLGSLWIDAEDLSGAIPYRWVLASRRETAGVEASFGDAVFDSSRVDAHFSPSEVLDRRLEALAVWARRLTEDWLGLTRRSAGGPGGGSLAQAELIARLTAIVESQEAQRNASDAPPEDSEKGVLGALLRYLSGKTP